MSLKSQLGAPLFNITEVTNEIVHKHFVLCLVALDIFGNYTNIINIHLVTLILMQ